MYALRSLMFLTVLATPLVALGGYSTTSGVSNTMNPALSVNALFRADYSRDDESSDGRGIGLQETELQLTSIVDPFWKANVIIAIEPDEGDRSTFELGVEEARIDAQSLPAGLALRLGKFFVPFGKHSPMHTHNFPFVEAPRAVTSFLGEGFSDPGVQLAVGLPLPWWSDITAYGLNGGTQIFDGEDPDLAWGARWANLWDVSAEATLELGGSAVTGPGSPSFFGDSGDVTVYGVDVTYKWVCSTRSHGPALTLMSEVLVPDLENNAGDPNGWYVLAQYRCHHNWWLGLTHGQADQGIGILPDGSPAVGLEVNGVITPDFGGRTREYKINGTFVPSEFSALRFEIAYCEDPDRDWDDLRFCLQWNFTIGSHPAHTY
jgi:hypothetical protein